VDEPWRLQAPPAPPAVDRPDRAWGRRSRGPRMPGAPHFQRIGAGRPQRDLV